jgi:hypothetical protein
MPVVGAATGAQQVSPHQARCEAITTMVTTTVVVIIVAINVIRITTLNSHFLGGRVVSDGQLRNGGVAGFIFGFARWIGNEGQDDTPVLLRLLDGHEVNLPVFVDVDIVDAALGVVDDRFERLHVLVLSVGVFHQSDNGRQVEGIRIQQEDLLYELSLQSLFSSHCWSWLIVALVFAPTTHHKGHQGQQEGIEPHLISAGKVTFGSEQCPRFVRHRLCTHE